MSCLGKSSPSHSPEVQTSLKLVAVPFRICSTFRKSSAVDMFWGLLIAGVGSYFRCAVPSSTAERNEQDSAKFRFIHTLSLPVIIVFTVMLSECR